MIKICEIEFNNHPVLGNLKLDFRDVNGNAVDTVILAGENGCGKSTVMNALFKLALQAGDVDSAGIRLVIDQNGAMVELHYELRPIGSDREALFVCDDQGWSSLLVPSASTRYPMMAIYSDVDINFNARQLASVTSMVLDESRESRRSTNDLPSMVNQLLIDVQALDDSDLSYAVRANPTENYSSLQVDERMPRFTMAFNKMFDNLTYDRIENANGHKSIIFKKNGIDVPIEALSSGEKQIVYRGCFLLKDAHALDGALVFIDEPEISLHPQWQFKIMDYYKGIFTNAEGVQTSQLFVVTHSPFIVHGDSRANDKVLVLYRDADGKIAVMDKPEYQTFGAVQAVRDAFHLDWQQSDGSVVFVEGKTDELYFKATLDAFDLVVPFDFKWIGDTDENGNSINTGYTALDHAAAFLQAQRSSVKTTCLYDCDIKRSDGIHGNVMVKRMPRYENSQGIIKGIENALVLDSVDLGPFYSEEEQPTGYGVSNVIRVLRKMDLCEYICSLGAEERQAILVHLKDVVQELSGFLEAD